MRPVYYSHKRFASAVCFCLGCRARGRRLEFEWFLLECDLEFALDGIDDFFARGSKVGVRLEVTATPVHRDGRLHRFSVSAREADGGRVIGTGEVTRVVVDAERFVARL